ncbi:MAG TPA: SDR family oxidoreductase [Vicinamibacterales bacterium]|nr:SDR family oxidoreductase [Vicinamibacterales bacterium]
MRIHTVARFAYLGEVRRTIGMDAQVVVVTGASSGIGRAVARAYGARRARVALLARNREALEACALEIRRAGGEAVVYPVDVSMADAVEAAAADVERLWGRIDVWVNVAMVTVFAPVKDTTAEEFRRVTEVTYLGYVHGTLSALRRMLPRDAGTIVQVGSALAYRSIPLQSAYCAAKAAIRGFTDSLRTELIHDGSRVRVTHVHLPAVNTPQSERQRNKMPKRQQPVPPLFDPEDIAAAILQAADRAPREMLVGVPTAKAVLGQKAVPGLLDRFLADAAWEPQFVDQPNDQTDDILFHPLPGDPGAHGPYRDRERGPDLLMRAQMHPLAAALTALGAGLAAIAIVTGAARGVAAGSSRSGGSRTGEGASRP